ncbi:hypothetical protein LCI18_004439 [Fusarium solani-melongenae]|uniref:Uncharacterized protein n=1 Tax=Fusarium solani subsp. cucurbitae TaxID=2747967 RepID=A0ACD3YX07_FUSSC|nr:hypothetical protein LCI18_004439 [Fusarium solani-melongenae]
MRIHSQQTNNVSSRRQKQNLVAQRKYRARQKEKRSRFESLIVASVLAGRPSQKRHLCPYMIDPDVLVGGQLMPGLFLRTCRSRSGVADLAASGSLSCLAGLAEHQRFTCWWIVNRESFSLRDVLKYGMIITGHYMSPELYRIATSLSSHRWLTRIRSEIGHVDFSQVIGAGFQLLACLNTPEEPQAAGRHDLLPFVSCVNDLTPSRISRISFISAVGINARFLGLAAQDLADESLQSPFPFPKSQVDTRWQVSYRDWHWEGSCQAVDRDPSSYRDLYADLYPTVVQQTLLHHPIFDMLPWPDFRSEVIRAVYSNPPLVDTNDLVLDLWNDGLRCWRPVSADGLVTLHQGLPWYSENWEAAPWFLEKWECLTGGRDSDMWTTSAQWRSITAGSFG